MKELEKRQNDAKKAEDALNKQIQQAIFRAVKGKSKEDLMKELEEAKKVDAFKILAQALIRVRNERKLKEQARLHMQLQEVLNQINQANKAAKDMGRQIIFKAELKRIIDENTNVGSRKAIESTPLQIVIRVQNNEKEYFYDWSPEKFDNRFASIMDQWKDFMDSELPPIYNSLE